jgi:hypothetical protein
MNEPTPSRPVGRGGLVLAALATGAMAATADTPAVFWETNEVVRIDVDALDIAYHGEIITPGQLEDLNDDGKATRAVECSANRKSLTAFGAA